MSSGASRTLVRPFQNKIKQRKRKTISESTDQVEVPSPAQDRLFRAIRGPWPVVLCLQSFLPHCLCPVWLCCFSSLTLASPQQESQLSLGGQRCVGEPDEELAGAFPLFIRNAVRGQKQPNRTTAESRCSTDVVSVACGQPLGWGKVVSSLCITLTHSSLPSP